MKVNETDVIKQSIPVGSLPAITLQNREYISDALLFMMMYCTTTLP